MIFGNGPFQKGDGHGQSGLPGVGPVQWGPSQVQAIVLAGVHTWGDTGLDRVVCRPLLPIATRPLIWHVVDWLRREGVPRAAICGNSDTKHLRRSLGDGGDQHVALEYFEDVTPRGPAGCARDAAVDRSAAAFLVVEGTIIPVIDLGDLLEAHRRSNAELTMVTTQERSQEQRPNAYPKPAGLYVFSPSILESIPETGYQDIKELLIPQLYRQGRRILTYPVSAEMVPRVSSENSYLAVSMWAIERIIREQPERDGYVRRGDAWIHSSAIVSDSARFIGPVLVGPNCVIESGALLIGPMTIGAGSVIGSGAVVSRSVVWERCVVGEGSHIDQSILTDNAVLDPKTTLKGTVRVGVLGNRRTSFYRIASKLKIRGRGISKRSVAGSSPASGRNAGCPASISVSGQAQSDAPNRIDDGARAGQ